MANTTARTTVSAAEPPGSVCACRALPFHGLLADGSVDPRPPASPPVPRRNRRPRLAWMMPPLPLTLGIFLAIAEPHLPRPSPQPTSRPDGETTRPALDGPAGLVSSVASVQATLTRLRRAEHELNAELSRKQATHDLRREARILLNLGETHARLAGDEASLSLYTRTLFAARGLGDRRLEAQALLGIGGAHRARREPVIAIAKYGSALEIGHGDPEVEAAAMTGLAEAYLDIGRIAYASRALTSALATARRTGDRRLEAAVLAACARRFAAEGDFERAASYYADALRLWASYGDLLGQTQALAGLAEAHVARSQLEEALSLYHRALAIAQSIDNRPVAASILTSTGDVEARRGAPRQAISHYREAATLFSEAGELQGEARAQMALHSAYHWGGNLAAAARSGEQALRLMERLREAAPTRAWTGAFVSRRSDAERYMDLLMEQARLRPTAGFARQAFELSERARARSLLDAVVDRSDTQDPATPLPAMSLPAIQRLLDADTTLLEYFLGEKRSYLWAVTPTTFESFELPPRDVVESEARRAIGRWSTSFRWTAADDGDPALVRFSTTLLGGVAPKLGGRRLVVVADGVLRLVPFAALPLPGPSHQPLVTRHEVMVLPSASVLGSVRQLVAARPPPTKLLALLADPVYTPNDPRLAPAAALPLVSSLLDTDPRTRTLTAESLADVPRLPDSAREAAAILGLVPSDQQLLAATGVAANRRLATSARLGQYTILHLATHGLLSPRTEVSPAIVLSLLNRERRPEDGLLRAGDIARLDLHADLVVLSACSTALGSAEPAGDPDGLPEAFVAAGAARVLSSLWDVDDRATAELMLRFYRGILAQGMTAAAALRAAELDLRQDPRFRAPRYWSAFTLEGDWRGPTLPSQQGRRAPL